MLHPALVERQQQAKEARPVGAVAMGIEEAPGLIVEGRRCPAGRVEQGVEIRLRQGRRVEGAGRPAVEEQGVDGPGHGARVRVHKISLKGSASI